MYNLSFTFINFRGEAKGLKPNSYISQYFPKVLTAASAILVATGTVAFAISQAAGQQDPLVSESYLTGAYQTDVINQVKNQAINELNSIQSGLEQKVSELSLNYSDNQLEQELAKQVAAALGATNIRSVSSSFTNGTQLTLAKTTEICLTSGSATLLSGELINVTTGKMVYSGSVLVRNQLYMSPSANTTIKLTSPTKVDISGNYTEISGTSPAYIANYTVYADALNDLGLFSGSTNGYELERASTRAEGLVMLLRMLGEEERALNYKGSHPFTDVPEWADRYVAYAYEKGYTSGVSDGIFGSQNTLSLNDYMTFLLRALEYDDKKGDFSWETSGQTAVSVGILSGNDLQNIQSRGVLYRDDLVYASYNALFASCKNETFRLCDKLITAGIFTQTELVLAQNSLS